MSTNRVKIDFQKIPTVDLKNLCRVFCADIKRTFNDSEIQKDFKAWQRERKKEVDSSAHKEV